jgi:hypothetical protein
LRCFAHAFPQRVETFVFLLVVREQTVEEAAVLRTQFAQLEIDWLNQYDCSRARRVDAHAQLFFFSLIFFFFFAYCYVSSASALDRYTRFTQIRQLIADQRSEDTRAAAPSAAQLELMFTSNELRHRPHKEGDSHKWSTSSSQSTRVSAPVQVPSAAESASAAKSATQVDDDDSAANLILVIGQRNSDPQSNRTGAPLPSRETPEADDFQVDCAYNPKEIAFHFKSFVGTTPSSETMAKEPHSVLLSKIPRLRRNTLLNYEKEMIGELVRYWLAHRSELGKPDKREFDVVMHSLVRKHRAARAHLDNQFCCAIRRIDWKQIVRLPGITDLLEKSPADLIRQQLRVEKRAVSSDEDDATSSSTSSASFDEDGKRKPRTKRAPVAFKPSFASSRASKSEQSRGSSRGGGRGSRGGRGGRGGRSGAGAGDRRTSRDNDASGSGSGSGSDSDSDKPTTKRRAQSRESASESDGGDGDSSSSSLEDYLRKKLQEKNAKKARSD